MKLKIIILFLSLPIICSAQTADMKALNQRIDELESSILDLQLSKMGQRFQFGGEFGFNFEKFSTNGWTAVQTGPDERDINLYNAFFKLDANINVSDRISFYSSMFSTFYFNRSLVSVDPVIESQRTFAGSSFIKLNKAYIDYQIIKNSLILSAGRLPTTNGPPEHIKNADDRLGTYASIAYSIPFDGIALTYKSSFSNKHHFSIRGIFNPGTSISLDNLPGGRTKGVDSSVRGQMTEAQDLNYATLEYSTTALPFTDHLVFMFNFLDVNLEAPVEREVRGVLDSVSPGDTNVYRLNYQGEKAYSAKNYVTYLQLDNIFNSSFDFYSSYKYTLSKKHGSMYATIIESNSGGLGGVGAVHDLGGFIVNSDMSAGQQLHGLRYSLNENNFLGAEYISTNLGTTPSNLFNRRFTSLYAWIGKGGHAYYTKKVRKHNSTIRFGYVNFLRDHYFNNVNYSTIAQRIQNYYVNYVLAL